MKSKEKDNSAAAIESVPLPSIDEVDPWMRTEEWALQFDPAGIEGLRDVVHQMLREFLGRDFNDNVIHLAAISIYRWIRVLVDATVEMIETEGKDEELFNESFSAQIYSFDVISEVLSKSCKGDAAVIRQRMEKIEELHKYYENKWTLYYKNRVMENEAAKACMPAADYYGLPVEKVQKTLEALRATERETTDRAKVAPRPDAAATETTTKEPPRPDWIEAHKRGVTVPEFIKEAFAIELADGTMSKALFSRYENLRRDFYSYKRSNVLADWLRAIPTKAKLNTQRLAERAESGEPVRPAPRPRTEEQRLYDTALKRRRRAGLVT